MQRAVKGTIMAGLFVSTETTVRDVINERTDVSMPGWGALISVVPTQDHQSAVIVVGARFRNECAGWFTKDGLGELIRELQEVHRAMKP